MRETFRNLIVKEKLGLISKAQLVSFADEYIQAHDAIPDWTIKISLNESLLDEPLLDLRAYPINELDCKAVAEELLNCMKSQSIDLKKIGSVAQNLCLSLETDTELFNCFVWISDEVDLVANGYSSSENIGSKIEKSLRWVLDL